MFLNKNRLLAGQEDIHFQLKDSNKMNKKWKRKKSSFLIVDKICNEKELGLEKEGYGERVLNREREN